MQNFILRAKQKNRKKQTEEQRAEENFIQKQQKKYHKMTTQIDCMQADNEDKITDFFHLFRISRPITIIMLIGKKMNEE